VEGYRAYDSWVAGVEDWYALIGSLYINSWELRTPDAILPRYAPRGDQNNRAVYRASVMQYVDHSQY
jgi:hypothetical protein